MEHAHRKAMTEQNGGLAINFVEKAIDRQLQRIMASDGDVGSALSAAAAAEAARTLVAEDFEAEQKREQGKDRDEKAELTAEVERLVGMDSVKAYLQELADVVAYVERGGNPAILHTNLNVILTGNPGTGKTTAARLMARFLHVHGMLPNDNFVEKK